MSRRKSIVSNFGDLSASTGELKAPASNAPSPEPKPVKKPAAKTRRVGAGVIGATQRSLSDLREERDRLLQSLTNQRGVVTVETDRIDPSPFQDRLPDDDERAFGAFKATLANEGQKVPVALRVSTDDPTRFQVVFGHRRVRALRELGEPALALIVTYSDRDLVVAQGLENASRQDLSWVERALFAARMAAQGLKPRDIKAALGIDDAQLSTFRSVTNIVPSDVLEAIGRAPRVGRPRWIEFVRAFKGRDEAAHLVQSTLSADKVRSASSDDRFAKALAALSAERKVARGPLHQLEVNLGDVGIARFTKNGVRFVLEPTHTAGFQTFLRGEIEGLLQRYEEQRKSG